MAKDDIGGVWRTIGGRRVFIKDGQSLSEAMVASGKFKNLRSEYKKAKEEENKKEKQEWDKSDEDMLKSIYTYSNEEKDVEKDSYYKDLVDKYGKESVASKYKELQDKYDIVANTYTDSEGVTYNSLKEKEKKDVNEPSIHTQSGSYTPNELKNRDESIKQMYKDAWEGKKSYKELNDELEGLKKDGKVSQGELDALKYDASLETGDWQNNPKNAHNSEYIGDNKVRIKEDNKTINQLNNEMLGNKYKGNGETPNLVYSNGRRIDIANNENGGKTATIWKDGKIERKTNLPENVKGDKTKDYFDKYLKELDDKEQGFTQQTDMYGGTREYTKEQLNKMSENGVKPMEHSYTGGGWEGTKYDSKLSTKDIAKNINDYSKKEFPDVKLSRKTDYNGIDMYVMSSDKDMFVSEKDIDNMNFSDLEQVTRSNGFNWWAKENVKDYNTNRSYSIDDVRKYAKEQLNTTKSHDSNPSSDSWYLSDYGKKVISGLNKEMNSYNYDDSDGMVDYFNTNFYGYVHIGKWDKPYQVNAKATGETINNTLRQKAYQKYLKEHPSSKMTFEDFKDMRKQ